MHDSLRATGATYLAPCAYGRGHQKVDMAGAHHEIPPFVGVRCLQSRDCVPSCTYTCWPQGRPEEDGEEQKVTW